MSFILYVMLLVGVIATTIKKYNNNKRVNTLKKGADLLSSTPNII